MLAELESLQHLARAAVPALLDAAAKGPVIIVVAGAIVAAMRKRSAAGRQLVWLMALAALLVLPLVSAGLPAWQVLPGWAKVELPARTAAPAPAPVQVLPVASILPAGQPGAANPAAPAMPAVGPSMALPGVSGTYSASAAGQQVAGEAPPAAVAGDQRPVLPAAAPIQAMEPHEAAAVAPQPFHWSMLLQWALVLWATGAAVCVLPLLLGRLSLWRLSRASRRIGEGHLASLAGRAAVAVGLRRRVMLLQGPAGTMPMVWGVVTTKLLLPAEADAWPAAKRWVVLLHELAHAKRHDCLCKCIAHLACAVYWFNPLAWVAFKLMQRESETACDDLVLSSVNPSPLTGEGRVRVEGRVGVGPHLKGEGRVESEGEVEGLAGIRPSDYAQHLLEIATGLDAPDETSGLAACLPRACRGASSIAMARRSSLEGRLVAILDGGRNRRALTRWAVLAAIVLVAAVVVPLSIMKARAADLEMHGSATILQTTQPTTGAATRPATVPATMSAEGSGSWPRTAPPLPEGWDRKRLLDALADHIKHLADENLEGYELGREPSNNIGIRLTWKTQEYEPWKEPYTGHFKHSDEGTSRETGPSHGGLIVTVRVEDGAGQALRPQTLDNGKWKTRLVPELLIREFEALPEHGGGNVYAVCNVEYGRETPRELIEKFTLTPAMIAAAIARAGATPATAPSVREASPHATQPATAPSPSTSSGPSTQPATAEAASDYFPLKKGNEWTYEGTVRTQTNGAWIYFGKFRTTTKVVDEISNPDVAGVRLFIMKGSPEDAAWPVKIDEDAVNVPKASDYGYLVVGGKVYLVPKEELRKARAAVAAGKGVSALAKRLTQVCETPLRAGQRFVYLPGEGKGTYGWEVGECDQQQSPIVGVAAQTPEYLLRLVTGPDTTEVVFQPRVGITTYRYRHHGSVCDVDLRLVAASVHTQAVTGPAAPPAPMSVRALPGAGALPTVDATRQPALWSGESPRINRDLDDSLPAEVVNLPIGEANHASNNGGGGAIAGLALPGAAPWAAIYPADTIPSKRRGLSRWGDTPSLAEAAPAKSFSAFDRSGLPEAATGGVPSKPVWSHGWIASKDLDGRATVAPWAGMDTAGSALVQPAGAREVDYGVHGPFDAFTAPDAPRLSAAANMAPAPPPIEGAATITVSVVEANNAASGQASGNARVSHLHADAAPGTFRRDVRLQTAQTLSIGKLVMLDRQRKGGIVAKRETMKEGQVTEIQYYRSKGSAAGGGAYREDDLVPAGISWNRRDSNGVVTRVESLTTHVYGATETSRTNDGTRHSVTCRDPAGRLSAVVYFRANRPVYMLSYNEEQKVAGIGGEIPTDSDVAYGWGRTNDEGLACAIAPTAERGRFGDIGLEITVKNTGGQERKVVTHGKTGPEFLLEVRSSDGKVVAQDAEYLSAQFRRSRIDERYPELTTTVAPGQAQRVAWRHDLREWYPDLPPGKYTMTAACRTGQQFTLATNAVDFEVVAEEHASPNPATASDWVKAALAAMPGWELVRFDSEPSVSVGESGGRRLVIRKAQQEPMDCGQNTLLGYENNETNNKRKWVAVHRYMDIVAFGGGELPQGWAGKIDWAEPFNPGYFQRTAFLGKGMGMNWYAMATIFDQDQLRLALKLEGGDDRLALLTEGIVALDGGRTRIFCLPLLTAAGDQAIPYIRSAVGRTPDRELIIALVKIQSDAATDCIIDLYKDKATRSAAASALVSSRPYRKAAKEQYLDMFRQGVTVWQPDIWQLAEACKQYGWTEGLAIANELYLHPRSLDEFEKAFRAKRDLEQNPVPNDLHNALLGAVIRSHPTAVYPALDREAMERVKATALASKDTDAAIVLAVQLAALSESTDYDAVRATRDLGRRILLGLPRPQTVEVVGRLLESVKEYERPNFWVDKAMLPPAADALKSLYQELLASDGVPSQATLPATTQAASGTDSNAAASQLVTGAADRARRMRQAAEVNIADALRRANDILTRARSINDFDQAQNAVGVARNVLETNKAVFEPGEYSNRLAIIDEADRYVRLKREEWEKTTASETRMKPPSRIDLQPKEQLARKVEALTSQAKALVRERKYELAAEVLDQILKLDPGNQWAVEQKALLTEIKVPPQTTQPVTRPVSAAEAFHSLIVNALEAKVQHQSPGQKLHGTMWSSDREWGETPTVLDFSEILNATGQDRSPGHDEKAIRELRDTNRVWSLCSLLNYDGNDRYGVKYQVAAVLGEMANPLAVPALLAAAKANAYGLSGSENRVCQQGYRGGIAKSLIAITGLKRPRDMTAYDIWAAPELDFAAVEEWVRKNLLGREAQALAAWGGAATMPAVRETSPQAAGEASSQATQPGRREP